MEINSWELEIWNKLRILGMQSAYMKAALHVWNKNSGLLPYCKIWYWLTASHTLPLMLKKEYPFPNGQELNAMVSSFYLKVIRYSRFGIRM
jgi:hypothetical protein